MSRRFTNLGFVCIQVLYVALLFPAYIKMQEIYSYMGFENSATGSINLSEVIITIGLSIGAMSYIRSREIEWAMANLIFILMLSPGLIYLYFNPNQPYEYFLGYIIFFFTFIFTSLLSKDFRFKPLTVIAFRRIISILIILGLIPFFIAFGMNINWSVFALQDIYTVRIAAREKTGMITGYTYSWLSRILAPALFLTSLIDKKYLFTSFSLISILYLYSTSAHKSVFLGIILALGLSFIKSHTKQVAAFYSLLGSVCILAVSGIAGPIVQFFGSIIIYRGIFIPTLMGSLYFDFFYDYHTYWSQSPFNPFIEYPHSLSPPKLMGKTYYDLAEMSANTGLVGDGFMNMGLAGILINSIVASMIFTLIARQKLSPRLFGLILPFFVGIQNSPTNTVLLTHGLAILLLTILIIPQKYRIQSQ
jgi:hypothetical protein